MSLVGRMTVADLPPHSVLTHARHTQAYGELVAHVATKSLPTTGLVSSNSLAPCVQMAVDGTDITLLPKPLVVQELRDGARVEVDVNWKPAPLRCY